MHLKPKVFADQIFYFESLIPDSHFIVDAIETSDKDLTGFEVISPWQEWKTNDDINPYFFGQQKQINKQYWAASSTTLQEIVQTLEMYLHEAGKYYAEHMGIDYIEPSPLSISKYSLNKSMGPHVDSYDTPGVYPLMSGVIYLNESDGGELHFPKQNILLKPQAGSIIIFPSVEPFFHESMPVKSGWKYIAPVFWIKRDQQ